jgi:hypothetical protein
MEFWSARLSSSPGDQVPTAMRDPRILECWVFIHALASTVDTGVLDLTERRIKSLLIEAAGTQFGPQGDEKVTIDITPSAHIVRTTRNCASPLIMRA